MYGHAIQSLNDMAAYLTALQSDRYPDLEVLAAHTQRVIQGIVTSERCAAHITEASNGNTRGRGRKKARPFSHAGGL